MTRNENAQGNDSPIQHPVVRIDWPAGALSGAPVRHSEKRLGDLRALFLNGASSHLADDTLLYSVDWFGAGPEAASGGLLFGCTRLEAGKVGDEFFMTHGHFHAQPTRAELYLPVSGEGLLLRMDREGHTWAEAMLPGHIHSIDGHHAHRVVNTCSTPLIFWAYWPADAGYDYETIRRHGFGIRAFEDEGKPALVATAHREHTVIHA